MKTIKLRAVDVVNKEFQVDYQGYDPHEVDVFLDMVAVDYQMFEAITNDFNKEIKYLRQQINDLQDKNDVLKAQLDETKAQKARLEEEGFSKADLIKRIHNLEGKLKND
ncbi:DivIVA domain-containing protein [Spiroplasma syrphidicola EA-1]|uniref:DivIVA domain-containing protein n=1 Tax=Spiroplasma syrphidicola EA-1 TaxID=1276229 RepID=R4U4D9_9MOLU|nr:DivIVA domain-containing protein [Spiroplasma syrphidicola]AGM26342.1 DivIVA domain-containing protein [Spiroplasma syrphidicola EA-1]